MLAQSHQQGPGRFWRRGQQARSPRQGGRSGRHLERPRPAYRHDRLPRQVRCASASPAHTPQRSVRPLRCVQAGTRRAARHRNPCRTMRRRCGRSGSGGAATADATIRFGLILEASSVYCCANIRPACACALSSPHCVSVRSPPRPCLHSRLVPVDARRYARRLCGDTALSTPPAACAV